eukprot:gnl/MRDRNA2_/MRDRNA2_82936_c0_seq2.p1 gnl/MRDRNA2_/MRDRNA2_82936_c0~~gnl/MRDRNA2_/MRDRNA2_82936_c0_seq2.p1  ORF type:complete len:172 (+),score=12.63 gnl/MRDRNA2_/MRDRNA2_82936_c0_seq2:168-683(+)
MNTQCASHMGTVDTHALPQATAKNIYPEMLTSGATSVKPESAHASQLSHTSVLPCMPKGARHHLIQVTSCGVKPPFSLMHCMRRPAAKHASAATGTKKHHAVIARHVGSKSSTLNIYLLALLVFDSFGAAPKIQSNHTTFDKSCGLQSDSALAKICRTTAKIAAWGKHDEA